MRCVVQRVSGASVLSDGVLTGRIDKGLMILVGVMDTDTEDDVRYMAQKAQDLRIFEDDGGKMNRSVKDVNGAILAVSQFTLCADARGGRRPSFVKAARPEKAIELYNLLLTLWRDSGLTVETGVFRAHMEVSLVNDGPVTILLDSKKEF
ncbi:MAG: D-aminoacyl-tRNA deacylase [Clostridia bacterium]|nr:D-aminoacyl-tRNA deacylase [Clostridia bacterium]